MLTRVLYAASGGESNPKEIEKKYCSCEEDDLSEIYGNMCCDLKKMNLPNGLSDFLPKLIFPFIFVDDFDAAFVRANILCNLIKTDKGGLSIPDKMFLMKIKLLNGEFDDLKEWVANQKQKSKKRNANKRMRKKKAQPSSPAATQQREVPVETVSKKQDNRPSDTRVIKKEDKKEGNTQGVGLRHDNSPWEKERRSPNLKKEYNGQERPVKKKTRPAFVSKTNNASPKTEQIKTESPEYKNLSEDDLMKFFANIGCRNTNDSKTCDVILSGSQEYKKLSRDDLMKFFANIGCVVDQRRGKGSHGAIIAIYKGTEIVGGLPDFGIGLESTEGNEAFQKEALIIPQWNKGNPMPWYILKNCQRILERLGSR